MTSVRTSAGVATAPQESLKFPELSDDILHLRNEHALSDELASPAPGDFPNFDNLWSGRADGERWQVRRGGGLRPQTYGHHVGRHGRQKSISEALQTVRDRKGSVSQSAQDIAQALKAPVSIKLVVCHIPYFQVKVIRTYNQASLWLLVRHLDSSQRILKGHLDCLSKTHDLDSRAVSLCLLMVHLLRRPGTSICTCATSTAHSPAWHQTSKQSHIRLHASPHSLSNRWSYTKL